MKESYFDDIEEKIDILDETRQFISIELISIQNQTNKLSQHVRDYAMDVKFFLDRTKHLREQ